VEERRYAPWRAEASVESAANLFIVDGAPRVRIREPFLRGSHEASLRREAVELQLFRAALFVN